MSALALMVKYSSIVELVSSLLMMGIVIWLSLRQYRLNKKVVEKPNWIIDKVSVGGKEGKCSAGIWIRNNGGIGTDIRVIWAHASSTNAPDDKIPKAEPVEGEEVTLRKESHPGDTIRVEVDIENLDQVDFLRVCVRSDEDTDQPKVSGDVLKESLENGEVEV